MEQVYNVNKKCFPKSGLINKTVMVLVFNPLKGKKDCKRSNF